MLNNNPLRVAKCCGYILSYVRCEDDCVAYFHNRLKPSMLKSNENQTSHRLYYALQVIISIRELSNKASKY